MLTCLMMHFHVSTVKITAAAPFSMYEYKKFRGMDREIMHVEHAHDETVLMGINSEKYFKGVKNVFFKYGGYGIDFAEPLYKMGLLSEKPVEVDGQMIVPRNLMLKMTPSRTQVSR